MFKQNTVRQALAWVPQIDALQSVGAARPQSANDEPFLPPPPPDMASRITNFGGRHARYKKERQQQLRVYDPFIQGYVTFSQERYLHA